MCCGRVKVGIHMNTVTDYRGERVLTTMVQERCLKMLGGCTVVEKIEKVLDKETSRGRFFMEVNCQAMEGLGMNISGSMSCFVANFAVHGCR